MHLILVSLAFLSLTFCSDKKTSTANKGAPMKITAISYSGSNPSMGPHNKPSSRSLDMSPYQAEAEDFLDNTQVNGTISMRDYIQLVLNKKQDEVVKVHQAFDYGDLNQGERIINLNIGIEGHETVSLRDLRRFSLTGEGFKKFDTLIREKGTVSQEPSEYEMREAGGIIPKSSPEISIADPEEN